MFIKPNNLYIELKTQEICNRYRVTATINHDTHEIFFSHEEFEDEGEEEAMFELLLDDLNMEMPSPPPEEPYRLFNFD